MSAQYPIRAAAKLTGITLDTLRAWERRYQAVKPERTARGRMYSESDVRRLSLLRSAVEWGHAIGQIASLSDAELQRLTRSSLPAPPPRTLDASALPHLPELQTLLDAIQAFDYQTVNEELGRLALLMRPPELVHRVVLPLMRLAGEKWEHGDFQIAQEHMLSACVRNLLGGLVRLEKQGTTAVRLLLTTPSTELHEFGILAAAMLAVGHDLQVAYLGPNLPALEILSAAGKYEPQVVVLGIMRTNASLAVRKDIHRLASELPPATELWIGGTGANQVTDPASRKRALIIEDLAEFERHLSRVKLHSASL